MVLANGKWYTLCCVSICLRKIYIYFLWKNVMCMRMRERFYFKKIATKCKSNCLQSEKVTEIAFCEKHFTFKHKNTMFHLIELMTIKLLLLIIHGS